MKITPVPSNDLGLTHYSEWCSDWSGQPLDGQLKQAGVAFSEVEIPHLVGFAGNARLIHYTSPKTGRVVTVLCVPHRTECDSWSEEYFTFEGMTIEAALEREQFWLDAYDSAKTIIRNLTPERPARFAVKISDRDGEHFHLCIYDSLASASAFAVHNSTGRGHGAEVIEINTPRSGIRRAEFHEGKPISDALGVEVPIYGRLSGVLEKTKG